MAVSLEEAVANGLRPITLSGADRVEPERLQRASSTPAGLSRRVRAVLLMAQGLSGVDVAQRVGYTLVQVSRLRRRFAEQGVAGLPERPRSGRPPTITAPSARAARCLDPEIARRRPDPLDHPGSRAAQRGLAQYRAPGCGALMPCSRTALRRSSSPPTPTPRRRSTTWWACP